MNTSIKGVNEERKVLEDEGKGRGYTRDQREQRVSVRGFRGRRKVLQHERWLGGHNRGQKKGRTKVVKENRLWWRDVTGCALVLFLFWIDE